MNNLAVNSGENTGNSSTLSSADSPDVHPFKVVLNDLAHKISPNLAENSVSVENNSLTEPSMLLALSESISHAQQQIKILAPSLVGNNPALLERIKSMKTDGTADQNFTDIVRELRATSTNNQNFQEFIKNTGEIVDSFESLPEMTQAKIATAQTFFRPTSFNKGAQAQQGLAIIKNTQNALGIEDPDTTLSGDTVSISQTTTRAILARMKALGAQNPDLGAFDAPVFDGRAVAFLENLQAKQMKEAGVGKENLNAILLNLWAWENLRLQGSSSSPAPSSAMQELGETSSLLSAMRYMTSGALTNGTATTPPTADTPWDWKGTNDNSSDIFFNESVYNALQSYNKVSMSELLAGSNFNFRDDNIAEAITRLREKSATEGGKNDEALQALEIKFRHYAGEDSQGNPTLARYDSMLTKHEVGLIAIEIMSIQAKKLCIEEKDINQAIEDGRFMPNRADLSLVDTGFGYPPGALETLPPEQRPHADTFLIASRHALSIFKHRSEAVEDRFGSISADSIKSIRASDSNKFAKVDDDYIASIYQSPAKRYGEFSADSMQNGYDKRRQPYLNNLGIRLEQSGCVVPNPDPAGNKPSSAPTENVGTGVATPSAAPPAGTVGVGGVGVGDGDTHCVADKAGTSPCSNNTDSASTSPCGAADKIGTSPCSKDFGGAVGTGAVNTSTAITENIEGTTGSKPQEPVCLPADKLSQGCKVTNAAYP